MPEPIRWGLDNPLPLFQMKTELVWACKYDVFGRKVAPVRVKLPFRHRWLVLEAWDVLELRKGLRSTRG